MLIGSGKRLKQIQNNPIIKIRDHITKQVYKQNVLEIDDKLQWTKHVEKQTKKISCSTSSNTTYDVQVIVLPYFNYCSAIWYDGNKMHAEKILKLQKRAALVIASSGLEERSSKIFQMLKWTKLQSILKDRELVMRFK